MYTLDHRVLDRDTLSHNSFMFGAVGAAEQKKSNCHKYATFGPNFYVFMGIKIAIIVASALESCIISL